MLCAIAELYFLSGPPDILPLSSALLFIVCFVEGPMFGRRAVLGLPGGMGQLQYDWRGSRGSRCFCSVVVGCGVEELIYDGRHQDCFVVLEAVQVYLAS